MDIPNASGFLPTAVPSIIEALEGEYSARSPVTEIAGSINADKPEP